MRGSPELSNGGLRALLLDGRVLDTYKLDFLGRLDLADKSVPISRLLSIRFLAQNASPRDADSGKMISESSSI